MSMLTQARTLKRNPSIRRWEAELLRIKAGERRSILLDASYEEWVEQLIEDADDRADSESMFLRALDRVVQGWQPEAADWEELHAMLSLIASNTPKEGYRKLFIAFDSIEALGHKNSSRTLVWILDALHQYYPVTPLGDDDESYRAYLNLLRHSLGIAGCGRTSARRLVERDPESLLDPQILRIIQYQPIFLTEMIDLALGTPGETLQNYRLSSLHESAVNAGSESLRAFVEAIEARGGRYEHQATAPRVILPRKPAGVNLPFRYDRNARAYVMIRTTEAQNAKADIIQSIEEQVHASTGSP